MAKETYKLYNGDVTLVTDSEAETKYIPIGISYRVFAKVDKEDYEMLIPFKWRRQVNGNVVYAFRDNWVNGVRYRIYMHRVVMGAAPGQQLDHANRDGLDNRKSNLRFCTTAQNAANRKLYSTNKSGRKGVSWDKQTKRWKVSLGKQHLGYFTDLTDAARAHDTALAQKYGEFARTQ